MNRITDFLSRFNSEYFFSVPTESNIVYVLIGFYVILAIATIVISRKISKVNEVYREFAKSFFWVNLSFVFTGLFLVFNRYEQVAIFSWRFWHVLLFGIIVLTNTYFYFIKKRNLESQSAKLLAKKRKEKWLTNQKKRKK